MRQDAANPPSLRGVTSFNGYPDFRQDAPASDAMRPQTATENATGLCHAHDTPDGDSDPDFADVIAAWPSLPEAVRAGIVAMVRASSGSAVQTPKNSGQRIGGY
jgi:hypothetical protein